MANRARRRHGARAYVWWRGLTLADSISYSVDMWATSKRKGLLRRAALIPGHAARQYNGARVGSKGGKTHHLEQRKAQPLWALAEQYQVGSGPQCNSWAQTEFWRPKLLTLRVHGLELCASPDFRADERSTGGVHSPAQVKHSHTKCLLTHLDVLIGTKPAALYALPAVGGLKHGHGGKDPAGATAELWRRELGLAASEWAASALARAARADESSEKGELYRAPSPEEEEEGGRGGGGRELKLMVPTVSSTPHEKARASWRRNGRE
eukprot:scaffold268527_cov36-Tisochrysis_lutea.AAC.1